MSEFCLTSVSLSSAALSKRDDRSIQKSSFDNASFHSATQDDNAVTLSRTEGSLSKGEFIISFDSTSFHSATQEDREINQ